MDDVCVTGNRFAGTYIAPAAAKNAQQRDMESGFLGVTVAEQRGHIKTSSPFLASQTPAQDLHRHSLQDKAVQLDACGVGDCCARSNIENKCETISVAAWRERARESVYRLKHSA